MGQHVAVAAEDAGLPEDADQAPAAEGVAAAAAVGDSVADVDLGFAAELDGDLAAGQDEGSAVGLDADSAAVKVVGEVAAAAAGVD